MAETGNCIGREQSGHIILSKYATTGDGILTAIKVMETVVSSKQPLSKLAEPVKMYPQVLKNLRVADKSAVRNHPRVAERVREISKALGDGGRILLRESGTEPLIRIMVEAESDALCHRYAEDLAALIEELGLL